MHDRPCGVGELCDDRFDVAVIGGGVNGAAVCHDLARVGYRTLLIDRGDFASGTSQASTMLIWGGLLYLKDFEFATVRALCRDRDRLVADRASEVAVQQMLYVPAPNGRSGALVEAALRAYWLIGLGRRAQPRRVRAFPEQALLRRADACAYAFEEGVLCTSDARFVLGWITGAERLGATARNYVCLDAASFDRSTRLWRLDVRDTLSESACTVQARAVVNTAGPSADAVNGLAGIVTPYRHLLSRGVSISLTRDPRHARHMVFDHGSNGSAMTYAPWGPVSLWGSTDTLHASLDEARPASPDDVDFLMDELTRHLREPVGRRDIISVRAGVRPVAVRRDASAGASVANLSRRHRLHLDAERPWISVFGGKLSGCCGLAAGVRELVGRCVARGSERSHTEAPVMDAPTVRFPALADPVVAPEWATAHEHCRTIEDYLRRRTNIAQWVPRGGLGAHAEYLEHVRSLAAVIHLGNTVAAEHDMRRYVDQTREHARVLDGERPGLAGSGVPA